MTRLEKLQERISGAGLDGLLLTSPIARRYVTRLSTSAGALLVTPGEAFFCSDFRYIEMAEKTLKGFTCAMTTRENPEKKLIGGQIKRFNIKKLGFESDTMPVAVFEAWKKELGVSFEPAEKLVLEMRTVKDSDEAEKMIAAQRIAEKALAEALNGVLRCGMTERELTCELVCLMLKNGADGLSFDPIVVSGPNSSLPHGEPGDRQITDGDFVTMDFGCKKDGYCSDMTRTVAVGHATDEMREVYNIVLKAQLAGIAAAKAGALGKDIDGAARRVIDGAGYAGYFGHGFGHGLGLEVHEGPNANLSGETPLPLGSVISAEPGIYLPGKFGVRIEDVVQLTDGGCVNFTEAPKELIVIPR